MIEADPDGLDPNEPGAKLDSGKLRPGLVLGDFSRALTEVVEVGTYGARKYSDGGWQHVKDGATRYTDAGLRHQMKVWAGEELDPESGLLHLAHAAWNALAILELYLREHGET
jgi:hypothetical protein